MTGSWPSLASSSGKLPHTSPSPPVLQNGTASVVANRIFTAAFLSLASETRPSAAAFAHAGSEHI